MRIEPLTDTIGAIVHGVDLREPLDGENHAFVQSAFHRHQVIFFREQGIGPRDLLAFAKSFGALDAPHPLLPHTAEDPRVTIVLNNEKRPPNNDEWHSDVTFAPEPPLGSVLQALELPPHGGDTLWASMYAAYEALPEDLRRRLDGLCAEHSIGAFSGTIHDSDDGGRVERAIAAWPPVAHPVVRTHPVTGRKALFVNEVFTTRILGIGEAESAELLSRLFELVKRPELQVRFRWEVNSVAVWDNRCTQHYAMSDYHPHRRRMHRVTIAGDRPYHAASTLSEENPVT